MNCVVQDDGFINIDTSEFKVCIDYLSGCYYVERIGEFYERVFHPEEVDKINKILGIKFFECEELPEQEFNKFWNKILNILPFI